jgi:DNA-binding SARP family transcriptional activator
VVQPWELIETVWGEGPPKTERKSVQTYINVLRRLLGSAMIQTLDGGYRLAVDPDDVDLNRFERHIRDGSDGLNRGECTLAVESLSAALGLWPGEPPKGLRRTRPRPHTVSGTASSQLANGLHLATERAGPISRSTE